MIFSILVFLFVLSALIFFHELGHFVAAKACGIYVDRFSIGMPPRLFGWRLGETDYCVSALPIGGYVKMAGQEDAPLSEEEREKDYGHVPSHRWFNNKPVWQRIVVLLAGPFMNLVLAVFLYALLAALGGQVPEWEVSARIGAVEPGSPAAAAPLYRQQEGVAPEDYTGQPEAEGWQTGDVVVSLDGRRVDNITDLAISAILGGVGTPHYAVIERRGADETAVRYVSPIAPALLEEEAHARFGVAPFETVKVGKVLEGHPAEAAGIEEGDLIVRANGKSVDRSTFIALVEQVEEGATLNLEVMRGVQQLTVSVQPKTVGRLRGLTLAVGPALAEGETYPVVAAVNTDFAEGSGIQRKDVIVEVEGQPATLDRIQALELRSPGKTLRVKVRRPAILLGLLQDQEELTLDLPVDPVRAIGVALSFPVEVFHRVPAAQIVPEAFRQSYLALERTLLTVKALIVRDVSPKDVGGPVMIFDVTAKAAQAGLTWLLKITAFISINLCVFNLLPLPVLDGGGILLQAVEGIRRKPLSPQFQERFQQLGLLLIVSLMLFVTWNDLGRWISELKP